MFAKCDKALIDGHNLADILPAEIGAKRIGHL